MNSCLYRCQLSHKRLKPKYHRFRYDLFMFHIDLDELDQLDSNFTLIRRNAFSPYEFRDSDHFQIGDKDLKSSIIEYARQQGLKDEIGKVTLVTHLRTWGHIFNPVSFYFLEDSKGKGLGAIAEVANTFMEQKMFFISSSCLTRNAYRDSQDKNFYVSPFSELDTRFHFQLAPPSENLAIAINESQEGDVFFYSSLTGKRVPLTDAALFAYSLKFPLITLKVIGGIHWNALLLFLKKVPFFRKSHNPELQAPSGRYIPARRTYTH
ncbi:MAG: DUF1365 domain-containing protein [Verrucomicrobiota bacterium]